MDIRRLLVVCDTINSEGGLPAIRPVTRVAACAVIRNPLAGVPRDDLGELVPLGAELGELLVRKALAALPNAASWSKWVLNAAPLVSVVRKNLPAKSRSWTLKPPGAVAPAAVCTCSVKLRSSSVVSPPIWALDGSQTKSPLMSMLMFCET